MNKLNDEVIKTLAQDLKFLSKLESLNLNFTE